jgi:hypothetical protein
MNNLPTNPEQPDELDRILAEFFKAQLKHPWPNAPAAAAAPASEPAGPRATRRDGSARARFTLAASVALALGACWALSNDFEPTATPAGTPVTPAPGMLPGGGADGSDHPTLQKMQENNAKPPKIDLGNGE